MTTPCEEDEKVHEGFAKDISVLRLGHADLSKQIEENTALTRQSIAATKDVEAILITLKTLMAVAKWVSAVAIAVSSLWGLAVLVATTYKGPK